MTHPAPTSLALRLTGMVQHYAWGKRGEASAIWALIDHPSPGTPLAELWFGAHPKAPSATAGGGDLRTRIAADPEGMLGSRVAGAFHGELPFLFKILSIAEPLSIQLHPSREQALRLHARSPAEYPDAGHKPEIGVALSPVQLLYGFRSGEALAASVRHLPELSLLIDNETLTGARSGVDGPELVARLFRGVLTAPAGLLRDGAHKLFARLSGASVLTPEDTWVRALQRHFPDGDPGLFCIYLLNLITLTPGEGIFIAPGVPHAYLEGDLAECMASSDNVVRAGLTPKFKDVETLLAIADYAAGRPEPVMVATATPGVRTFRTPAPEFVLEEIMASTELPAAPATPRLIFCRTGRGVLRVGADEYPLTPGAAWFIPASAGGAALHLDGGASLFLVRVP